MKTHIRQEDYTDGYYHFRKDAEEYPNAWAYVVWSRRGPGKTYSSLRMMLADNIQFVYMKRTKEDVELICNPIGDRDLSPFAPINRDFGTDIKPKLIDKGIGGFYHCSEEGEPVGKPVGLILALSAIKGIKGLELSDVEYLIFDEFIPQIGEITRRGDTEGEMLLSLYMTIIRDKIKRGTGNLKLVLFANAEQISTAVTRTLEIVDTMAEMYAQGETIKEYKGMLLHRITDGEIPLTENEINSPMYKAMCNTVWGRKAFGGDFASQDFSNICKQPIKKSKCLIAFTYKQKKYCIYLNNKGEYYVCTSIQPAVYNYDLDTENDQKLYSREHYNEIRFACAEGLVKFEKYSLYDLLIVNYKNIFKI